MTVNKKPKKTRIDTLLVARGLADSLKQAQALVMAGVVIVGEQRANKASDEFSPEAPITLKTKGPYVSRGGDKLANAVKLLKLEAEFQDKTVLDIGASTGGFTDMVLSIGARRVVAVEVGFNQLAWKLRQDPRVLSLEQTDICDFDASTHGPFDWVIADISFSTLASLAPAIWQAGSPGTRFLLLVKPQFELPINEVPKGGVVTDAGSREKAVTTALAELAKVGFTLCGRADLEISGRKGNWEVMLYLQA
jgi:23S rRNA (cytidine1920-2'-O)/16S rRNA (cytidine1409-2'-O)-methyltransferase